MTMLFSKFDAFAMVLGTLSAGVEVIVFINDNPLGYDWHSTV